MRLSKREIATLLAFGEVVIPAGGAIPVTAKDVPIADFAQNYIQNIPRQVQLFVRINLWLIEYCTWIFVFPPFRFSKASAEKRQLVIDKLRNSRYYVVRGVYTFVCFLILVPYYLDKSVLGYINYEL